MGKVRGITMKTKKKRSFAILLVLLFCTMLLKPFDLKVKAEESSAPQYLDYTKGYVGFVYQWKNKSFLVVQDNTRKNTSMSEYPNNLKFIVVENGKEKVITTDNKFMPREGNAYQVYKDEMYFRVYSDNKNYIYKYNLNTLQLSLVQEINPQSKKFVLPQYEFEYTNVLMNSNGKITFMSNYRDVYSLDNPDRNNAFPNYSMVLSDGDKETSTEFNYSAERPEFFKSYDIYNFVSDKDDNTWFSVKKLYEVSIPKGATTDVIRERENILKSSLASETVHPEVFIYKIDSKQNVIKIDAKELTYYDGYIRDLKVDLQGNLWISGNYHNNKTNVNQAFIAKASVAQDNTLKVLQKFTLDTQYPVPIELDVNGGLWALDNGKIKKYENGNLVTKYEVYNAFHNDRFHIYDDNNLVVYGDAGYKIIASNVSETNNNTTTNSSTTNDSVVANLDTNKLNKNGVNEINPIISNGSQVVEARVDASAVNGGTGSLKMNASNVTIELPFSAVDYEGTTEGSYISVKQNIIANDPLLSTIKDIGKVFDFSLATYKQDGTKIKDIHNFKSGKAKISVKLTNEDIKNLDTTKLSAFYYNEETKMWESVGGSFDKETMTFTFETSHFSKYTIAQINGALPQTGAVLNNLDLIVLGSVFIVFGALFLGKKFRFKHMSK